MSAVTGQSTDGNPGVTGTGLAVGVSGALSGNLPDVAPFVAVRGDGGSNHNTQVGPAIIPAGPRFGVFGTVSSPSGAGVAGQNDQGPGVSGTGARGVQGTGEFIGIWGLTKTPGQGLAGQFDGNVQINGRVDHKGEFHCTQTVFAVDVTLTGADCAEEFDSSDPGPIDPGTVMVIDAEGAVRPSEREYDKRVAGVVSGAGSYRPAITLDKHSSGNRLPIAMFGKVYCKVDAQYAAVEVGDLLTTSSTPGHAMKAANPLQAFGSVIGKALRSLEAGQGLIPILIALQ